MNVKKLLSILCLVLLVSCSPGGKVLEGPFLIRDGITYDQKTNKPITGNTETFHENGQLKQKGNYKNGKEISKTTFTYYDHGQLRYVENFKDGEPSGLQEIYYIDGQLEEKINFKNGVPHGDLVVFYENGQLEQKIKYKNGNPEGKWRDYNEDGKERSWSPRCFENGELVDCEN